MPASAGTASIDTMTRPHTLRWLVLAGVWLIYAMFGLVATSLAPLVAEIERDLDLSHAAMGSIMGAWQLVFIGAAVPCGIVLDRLGSRWALAAGACCVAASVLCRSFATDYVDMLLAVMLFGVGGPVISAGAPKVIANWFDGSQRGFAMGIYVTGPALGGICSLTLTHSWLLPLFDGAWRPIYVTWAVLALVSGAVWVLIASLPEARARTGPVSQGEHTPHREVLSGLIAEPAVRIMLLLSVAAFMIGHGFSNWLPELLVQGGMSPRAAGYWAAIPTLVGIIGSLAIPRLATPERRFRILTGLAVSVLLATLLLQVHHPGVLFVALMLQGIARASLMTVLILTLVELPGIGERHAGTASGLFFSAAEFGGMLGPLSLGLLYDVTHGFGAGLAFFSVLSVGIIIGVDALRRLARH